MRTIEKNLTTLTRIIYLLLFIVASAPVLSFWWPESAAFFPPHDLLAEYGGVDQLAVWQQVLGFFVATLPAGLLCWSLILVLKLIKLLKIGKWFDEECEVLCKNFSKVTLWFALTQLIHRTVLVLVFTATNPPGEKVLMFSLTSDDIFALVPVVFALIFAHIISLARQQREELNQII